MTRPELTEVETQSPYADYYYRPSAAKPEAVLEQIKSTSHKPEDALKFLDINDLLLPGYLPIENGHCHTGYAMAMHCAKEYNNLAQILPELYQEYSSTE